MRQSDDASNRQADALDAVAAAPDHHDVLLESQPVKVLGTRLCPARTPVHTHCWPAVLYVLGSSAFIRHDADGNTIVDSRARGMMLYGPARCSRASSRTLVTANCTSSPSNRKVSEQTSRRSAR